MKKHRQLVGLLIAVALIGAGAVTAGAAEKTTTTTTTITKKKVAKLSKAGWWVRVNPSKTSATTIWFKIGMEKKNSKLWRTWKPGEALEFDVPAEFLNAAELYIHGTTDPHNKHAMFCVFYMDHGVEQFHFDGTVDHNMKPSDSDRECKP